MEDKKLILAVETSGMTTELAIMKDGSVVASAFSGRKFAHSELINIMFDSVLKAAGATPSDISCVAVSIGPGFFTALRVGLSFAKAMAFTHGTKVVPVVTIDALAHEVPPGAAGRVVPAIDAQKNEVYYAVFRAENGRWVRETDYAIGKPDAVSKLGDMFVGSGAVKYGLSPRPHHDPVVPSAKWIGRLAIEAIQRGEFADPAILEPFYLRLPDAVVNRLKKGNKR